MNLDEHWDSFEFLAYANNASEWMWKIYYKYMAGVLINVAFTSVLSVFYCWLNDDDNDGHLDTANFYHPQAKITYWNSLCVQIISVDLFVKNVKCKM